MTKVYLVRAVRLDEDGNPTVDKYVNSVFTNLAKAKAYTKVMNTNNKHFNICIQNGKLEKYKFNYYVETYKINNVDFRNYENNSNL